MIWRENELNPPDAPILSQGTNQARRGSKRRGVKREAHRSHTEALLLFEHIIAKYKGTRLLRQAQSGQAVERVLQQRIAGPCRRRAVQVHERHGYRPRSVVMRSGL